MAINTQHSEDLRQVLITPNRDETRQGMNKHGVVGRIMPSPATERSTVLGKSNTAEGGETGFWGRDGFTFGDLLDLVNPLQHIPIVSTVYRAITGDEIGIGPRMLGGAVLGGVIGFGVSAMNAALEYETGKDAGNHALLAMGLVDPEETLVATATPATDEVTLANNAQIPTLDEGLQELTEEQATALLLAQPATEMTTVNAPSPANDDLRSLYTLGTMQSASQRYQQTQVMDSLQNVALTMDIDG